MRRLIQLLLIVLTFFSAALDVWVGADSRLSPEFSQLTGVESSQSIEHASSEPCSDNDNHSQAHQCHLGHCAFETKTTVANNSLLPVESKLPDFNRFMPTEPIFYIPRPPAA